MNYINNNKSQSQPAQDVVTQFQTKEMSATVQPSLFVESIRSDSSEAPTCVFIHGWGMHSGIWAQLVETLKPNFNCLLLDLPGMGRSPLRGGDYTLEAILEQFVEALEPWKEESLHWVGWSLGAIVAAHAAPRFENSRSVTITAMGPKFIANDETAAGMNSKDFHMFKVLLDEDYEGTLYRFLGLNTKGSAHQRAEIRLLQQLVFTYGIPAQKALRGGLQILEQDSIESRMQNSSLATQMIFGEHDALVPLQQKLDIEKQYPHITAVLIPNAGHIPFLTQTDVFAQALVSFVEEGSV